MAISRPQPPNAAPNYLPNMDCNSRLPRYRSQLSNASSNDLRNIDCYRLLRQYRGRNRRMLLLFTTLFRSATANYRDIRRNYQMPHLTTSATSTATAYYGNIAAATAEC